MEFVTPEKAALLPIQNLAWVGDVVYELYSRQRLVLKGQLKPGRQTHRVSAGFTSATGQAAAVVRLEAVFTQQEANLLKRGRNTKGLQRSSAEYCQATGLEVVVGWLWLSSQNQRLDQLFQVILTEEDDQQ